MNNNLNEQSSSRQRVQITKGQKSPYITKQTNQSQNGGSQKPGNSTSKNIDINKMEDKKYREKEQKKRNLKKNKSFSNKNFEIIIDLLKFRKSSLEKAYIQVVFAFACIFISNIRVYRDLVEENYTVKNGSLSTVIDVLSYGEFTTILKLDQSVYQILFFLAAAFLIIIPILYIVCYFMHTSNSQIKVRKFFYGRWFVYAGEYYMWILLQPCYLTLMSYITCYEPIQTKLNLICDSSDPFYYIKISLASIGLFFGFCSIWFLSIFFFNGGFSNKKDSLTCDNTIHVLVFNLYRILFSVMICLKQQEYYYFIVFLVVNLVFSAYLSYQFFLNTGLLTFRNKYIRDLFKLLILILFAQNIAFTIDELQRNINIIGTDMSENSGQYTLIMSIIVFFIFKKISKSQEYSMTIGNDVKGCNYSQFKKKIYYLQHLLETSSEQIFQDVYFKGIISQHLNSTCFHKDLKSQKCFCQMKFLHDSKKNKDVNIDRCFYTINKNIFAKFVIKSWYQQYMDLNPSNFTAIIDYSEYIFNKMRNSCLSLQTIFFLKKKYIYPIDQFRLFRLTHYIHKVNRKKNMTSYKGNIQIIISKLLVKVEFDQIKQIPRQLNIENVIPIEQKIDRIKYKIQQILHQNIEFWNMLLKNVINLEELNAVIKRIFEEIDEIKKMWIHVVVYLNYRKKWRFYYAWYYLYILNQKVLLSLLERFSGSLINENEIFIEEYQTDQIEDDVGSVISHAKDDQDKINIKKIEMAFDRRSCVFRVASDNQGKIVSVNKPVLTTFGFTKYELENHIYITDLMPKSIAIQHPKYTSNFISTGKSKVLYSQKKVFCVMKKGNVFAAWKFLKLYVNLKGETEFISLIRPIMNPAGSKMNYIIFNDDWEIDAMTQQMYEYFMIDSELYRQQMILLANLKTKKEKVNDGVTVENKISVQNVQQNGMVLNILLIIPKLMKFTRLVHFLTPEDEQNFGIIPKKDNLGELATFFKGNKEKTNEQQQMKRIKEMTLKKKEQAQKKLAAKKNTSTQEDIEKINQGILGVGDESSKHGQRLTITHVDNNGGDTQRSMIKNDDDINEMKNITNVRTPHGSPSNGINLTVNQDDSIGQLLAIKSKNREKFEDAASCSPKNNIQVDSVLNQFSKQISNISIVSKNSSFQEIQDQIHGDLQQQEQMRKQIEKLPFANRRKTLNKAENNIEEEEEENEQKTKGDNQSSEEDDDLESDYGQDIYDSDGKKLIDQRLEKGEQLRLVARVPYNINQVMSSYFKMATSRLKKFDHIEKQNNQNVGLNNTHKEAIRKIKTHNSHQTYKESTTNLSFKKNNDTQTERHVTQKEEQEHQNLRDKTLYQLIKDTYTLHVRRKKTRQFKLICTTKFKKIGNKKIGIIKINNLEEIKYQQMLLLQQTIKNNKDLDKSNLTLSKQISGLGGREGSDQSALQILNKGSGLDLTLKPIQNFQQRFLSNIKNQMIPYSSQISGNISINDIGGEQQDSKVQEIDYENSKENGMGYQLDNFEEQNKSQEALKDIQKDFEKKQGSVTFSLNYADNIFIKEDIHQPKQQLNSIFQLQIFTRIVFLFILLFNIFTYFLGVNTYFTTISNQSERVLLIKQLNLEILDGYDNILDLIMLNSGSYTENILEKTIYKNKLGLQKEITSTSFNITSYFQSLLVDSNFQETLFDSSGSDSNTATSVIISGIPSKGNFSLDVYDMFQQYIYHINEVNNSMISQSEFSKISLTSPNIDFIRKNVFQYLNKHIYQQGQNAIDIVKETMGSISNFLLIITIILSGLIGLSFIFMWRFMSAICISFTSIFDSFEKIDLIDVKKIANYYQIILNQFSYAVDKDEFYSKAYMPQTNQLLLESDLQESKNDEESNNGQILKQTSNLQQSGLNQNMIQTNCTRPTIDGSKNSKVAAALLKVSDLQLEASDDNAQVKKNKILEYGNFLRSLKIKILIFYLLFTLSVVSFNSVYILKIYLNQQTLEMMREDGLVFINPITFNYVMLISVKENAIDPKFYQQNLYNSAKNEIDLFFELKQDVILNDLTEFDYNKMYNQVYKNNTCYSDVANDILTKEWIQDCSTILQKALLGGLNIFGTKFTEFVNDFKSLETLTKQLPSSTLYDDILSYSRGIYYANIFNEQIMRVWTKDILNNLNNIITFCSVLVIVASIVILTLYIILNEILILGRFRKEYDYFRSVYKMYFPEAIITKKKNIKFWLIKQGILKKK